MAKDRPLKLTQKVLKNLSVERDADSAGQVRLELPALIRVVR